MTIQIVKKRLLSNAVPAAPHVGGGTVFFVTDDGHRYLSNRVEREEGGEVGVAKGGGGDAGAWAELSAGESWRARERPFICA